MDPAEPLWKIVPTRDEEGRLLGDFMILIPGLREKPKLQLEETLRHLQAALEQYREVVFANLNLPLNVLWISVKSRPRIILDITASILMRVPEARLVAPQYSRDA